LGKKGLILKRFIRTRMMYVAYLSMRKPLTRFFWQYIDDETRQAIIVTSAVIQALGKGFIPITDTILVQAYEWAVEHVNDNGGFVKELFTEELCNRMAIAASSWINL
jgi:hypothetical protein